MLYNVHVYPIVHVKVCGVEAESQEEAMKKVDATADFHSLLDRDDIEYAEDVDCFLVDEQGDTEYENSVWYDKNYCPL